MSKKKIIAAEDITEKDILSVYQGILPPLFKNNSIDLPKALREWIINYVEFDFYFYNMENIDEIPFDNFYASFEKWEERIEDDHTERDKVFSDISLKELGYIDEENAHDKATADYYRSAIKRHQLAFPDKPKEYNYYSINADDQPRLTVGFFRYKTPDSDFTKQEITILEKLKPHIILLYRTVLGSIIQSQTHQDFKNYFDTCAKIAKKFELSDKEHMLLTQILFGYSNKEIAERNFISPHTAKTHVHNIFKKAGVKNRMHFISKFFTSPNRVEIT